VQADGIGDGARRSAFAPRAAREFEVVRREGVVHPEPPRELVCDVDVARAGHSFVELREEQDVGLPKGVDAHPFVDVPPSLHVPDDDAGASGRRGRGCPEASRLHDGKLGDAGRFLG
jgi:hypothetical protein